MSQHINQLLEWQPNPHLAGLPSVGADSHRNAMRHVAAAVTIITTHDHANPIGLTATAVCSVTADPARLVVLINKNTAASPVIVEHGRLCVNVLAGDQEDVGRVFAGMMPGVVGPARFDHGTWDSLVTGAPSLKDALVNIDCRVIKVFDESTHHAYLCEILATRERAGGEALIYLGGAFHHLPHS
ncbi:MAG: flavin reductase [Sphingomonadales bacterium]|nr:flavin reductase [Sphingomonadales bacterium]MDE2170590.1 flavin reductase [Sphingomonadales bacterium]